MYTPEFRGKQYNQGNLPNSLNDEDVRNQSCNKIWAVLPNSFPQTVKEIWDVVKRNSIFERVTKFCQKY